MTTENHPGRPKNNDSDIATFAGLPVNSMPGDITEIEYESALEATQAERDRQAGRRNGTQTGTGKHFRHCVIRILRYLMRRPLRKECST